MKRVNLVEAFAEDVHRIGDVNTGNEALTVKVQGGTLDFLAHAFETDEETIKSARFVRGELQLENGKIFTFWVAGPELGSVGDTTLYHTQRVQIG